MRSVLGVVTARGGSKGIPGKNTAVLAGKPLIAWTIEAAQRSGCLTRLIVSTDDERIARVSRQLGAEAPFIRPAELATDETSHVDVLLHVIQWLSAEGSELPDYILLLQPTSPLRSEEDIQNSVRLALEKDADAVISVVETPAHPFLAKRITDDGQIEDFGPRPEGDVRRQCLPPAFAPNGAIYMVRTAVFQSRGTFYPGRTFAYVMPSERSIDVDTQWDLHLAELVLRGSCRRARSVGIGGRPVGAGHPCFIIAEAGVNHNGSLDMALRLVDAAALAGADAIKFQTFRAEKLVAASAPKAAYQARKTTAGQTQFDMLKQLELGRDQFVTLRDRARHRGLIFLSTPFDEESLDLVEELDVPAIKVGSGELTNLPFLERVARKRKPIILSTGMAWLAEVDEAVQRIRDCGNDELILLHCVSSYPAEPAEVNLRAMDTLRERFDISVGYSDHTDGFDVTLAAVARGASVIEKHLTLDRSLPGPDHAASVEPFLFGAMVEGVRRVECALGNGHKRPAPSEMETAAVARKSLVVSHDLPAGTALAPDMLAIMRPGTGLAPGMWNQVIGRVLRVPVRAGSVLTLEMLE